MDSGHVLRNYLLKMLFKVDTKTTDLCTIKIFIYFILLTNHNTNNLKLIWIQEQALSLLAKNVCKWIKTKSLAHGTGTKVT